MSSVKEAHKPVRPRELALLDGIFLGLTRDLKPWPEGFGGPPLASYSRSRLELCDLFFTAAMEEEKTIFEGPAGELAIPPVALGWERRSYCHGGILVVDLKPIDHREERVTIDYSSLDKPLRCSPYETLPHMTIRHDNGDHTRVAKLDMNLGRYRFFLADCTPDTVNTVDVCFQEHPEKVVDIFINGEKRFLQGLEARRSIVA